MGIMVTYHRHNNTMYNVHKNVGAHYTWQNVVNLTAEERVSG